MRTSREGIFWIAGREALVLVAYHDGENPDGSLRYSIGFGDNSAKAGDKIDPKTAWQRLVANIRQREKIVNKHLKKPVTQDQYDSIMEAYYQGGTRNLLPLAAAVNAGEADKIPEILPLLDTNKSGEHKPGLKIRREASARIAQYGDYGTLFPIKLYRGDPRKTKPVEYYASGEDVDEI